MISPTCSNKGVRAHAIRSTLRQFWLLLALGLGYFFCTGPLFLIIEDNPFLLGDGYQVFRLHSDHFASSLFLIGVPAFGFLTALCLFFFLLQPRSCDTYFSLGIQRESLFRIRYGIGAGILLLSIVLPFLVSLLTNAVLYHSLPPLLLRNWIYLTLLLSIGGLFAYTLTVLVCSLCGSAWEILPYTALLAFLPNLLGWAVGNILHGLLPGSAWNADSTALLSPWDTPSRDFVPMGISLLRASILFGPVTNYLSDYYSLQRITVGETDAGGTPIPGGVLSENPHWGLLIGWALALLPLLLLTFFFFRGRKAETAGFSGFCRPLGVGSAVLIALCVFAGVQSLRLSVPLRLLLGLLGFAAAFSLVCLPAFHRFRRVGRAWLALPVSFAAVFLASLVLTTGGLGYSSRVPAVDSIETAEITYRGDPSRISGIYVYQSLGTGYYASCDSFTTLEDLAQVTELHRALSKLSPALDDSNARTDYADTRIRGPIEVRYTLKNGRVMTRRYEVLSIGVMEQFLKLDQTGAVFNVFENRLREDILENEETLILTDPYFQRDSLTAWSREERSRLLDCLIADLRAQTLTDHYFPKSDAEVLLSVRERRAVDYQSEAYTLYITPSFTRTLEFLREDDRYAFPEPPTVARAEIFRFDPVVGQKSYIWIGQDLFLRASDFYCFPDYVEYNITESRKHGYGYELLTPPEIPADRFPDFLPRLRSCWYASREVYVVRLTVPNEIYGENTPNGGDPLAQEKTKYIYKYLPADEAPDFLLEYLPE